MEAKYSQSDTGLGEVKLLADTDLCIAYGQSGIGGRPENQDSFGGGALKKNVILTVCDGMGGMNGGQTASRIAAIEILQTILSAPLEKWSQDLIYAAVKNANSAIYRKSVSEPRLRGMGTTATVLMLTPEAAFVTHIGDSRVYQLRNRKKVFRTYDHSKVFDMVSQKMMTEEQARTASYSNVITKALGIRPSVEMTVEKLPYKRGDRFVLCCDGIWNCLPEAEMLGLFEEKNVTVDEVRFLTQKVNGIGIDNGGGHDNLTTIIADIMEDSEYQYNIFDHLKKTWRKLTGDGKSTKKPVSEDKSRS